VKNQKEIKVYQKARSVDPRGHNKVLSGGTKGGGKQDSGGKSFSRLKERFYVNWTKGRKLPDGWIGGVGGKG